MVPFEASQGHFYRRQVIVPLCTGGFREITEVFDKVIPRLAREAAAGDWGPQGVENIITYLSILTTRVATCFHPGSIALSRNLLISRHDAIPKLPPRANL